MGIKDAYQEKIQAELREWQARIDTLKARADKARAEKKVEYYEQIETLRNKREQARQKLEELQAAGDSAWEDLKAGVDSALEDLGQAVGKATDRFKQDS
jgi:chromosome segregation ATPase